MQAAQHNFASHTTEPVGKRERSLRKGKVNRYTHQFRNGLQGGLPWSKFSSQYFTDQCGSDVPAKLVNASVGVNTCLPKLAWPSLG
jgi:hypothetical protein